MKTLIHILFEVLIITGAVKAAAGIAWHRLLIFSKKEMDRNPRAEAIWEHFEQHVGSVLSCGRGKCAILK